MQHELRIRARSIEYAHQSAVKLKRVRFLSMRRIETGHKEACAKAQAGAIEGTLEGRGRLLLLALFILLDRDGKWTDSRLVSTVVGFRRLHKVSGGRQRRLEIDRQSSRGGGGGQFSGRCLECRRHVRREGGRATRGEERATAVAHGGSGSRGCRGRRCSGQRGRRGGCGEGGAQQKNTRTGQRSRRDDIGRKSAGDINAAHTEGSATGIQTQTNTPNANTGGEKRRVSELSVRGNQLRVTVGRSQDTRRVRSCHAQKN